MSPTWSLIAYGYLFVCLFVLYVNIIAAALLNALIVCVHFLLNILFATFIMF